MKIFITGVAGFIGFHLACNLLKNKKNIVYGLDSLNNYYSKKIKNKRLQILTKKKNFKFSKTNLENKKKVEKIIKDFDPNIVYHMAGQPGVLYSFKNPESYKKNNLNATKVLCKICKKNFIKNFIYASSSSVYGDQKKFPIRENFPKNPKNYYAITKYKCEKIVQDMFKNTNINYKIFRFFSVYGPFGRPDMFIHKFLNSIKLNKKLSLHNEGKNFRDFTYIDDLIKILISNIKIKNRSKIFNICRSNPVKTSDLVTLLQKIYRKKNTNLIYLGSVKGEMLKTHGCNKKILKNFNRFTFTKLSLGLKKTINTFRIHGY